MRNMFASIIKNSLKYLSYYLIPDKLYRKILFKRSTGKNLNLKNPKSFNEKINARILYDENPIYTKLADKYLVRDYVKEKIGDSYLINLLGYYSSPSEINYDILPTQFVLKCNHDAGSVIIVKDKNVINKDIIYKKLKKSLKYNMYYKTREKHYKNIPAIILCEEYIDIFSSESNIPQPEDYKIHCFHGKPEYLEIQFSRFSNERYINIYDKDWNLQPFLMGYQNTLFEVPKPQKLEEMLQLAEKLSSDFEYCRVDFYLVNDQIFFGEITFTPCNGMDQFIPYEWDYKFGEKW